MRTHWYHREENFHLEFLKYSKKNVVKMFTPPKSGNPFEGKNMFRDWVGNPDTGQTGIFQKPAKILPWLAGGAGGLLGSMFGPAGAAVGGALGSGLTQGIQGGTTGLYGTPSWKNALTEGLSGVGSGAGIGGLMGAGALGGFQNAANAINAFGTPAAGATGTQIGSQIGYRTSAGNAANLTSQPIGSMAGVRAGTNTLSNAMNSYNAATGTGVAGAAPKSLTAGDYWNNLVGNATKGGAGTTALGAGVSALGALGGNKIEVPQSQYMGDYTSRLLKGSPMSQFGQEGLKNLGTEWNKPEFNPVSEDMYGAAIRKNKEMETQAEQALRTEYKGIRPGANIENDSGFRNDLMKMRERFANERASINTELAHNRENEYLSRLDNYFQNKTNYFMNTMKLSQDEINQYAQLAQLDTERLMAQTGLEAGEAAQFKQLFGDIGKMIMQKGMGLDFQSMLGIMGQGAK